MDDFGTGYSSLNYLQRFPFDRIKVDRSFVSGLREQPEATAIVKAIISLSASLNMTSTAEGVETEDQLAFLREESCQEVQGFLIGRPMPAGDVLPFLRHVGGNCIADDLPPPVTVPLGGEELCQIA